MSSRSRAGKIDDMFDSGELLGLLWHSAHRLINVVQEVSLIPHSPDEAAILSVLATIEG